MWRSGHLQVRVIPFMLSWALSRSTKHLARCAKCSVRRAACEVGPIASDGQWLETDFSDNLAGTHIGTSKKDQANETQKGKRWLFPKTWGGGM